MKNIGYEPGNISDQFKHGNLEAVMRAAGLKTLEYVELHSGEGVYETPKEKYRGSAVRALEIAERRGIPTKAHLHELRPDARSTLKLNTFQFRDTRVYEDWRDTIAERVKNAGKETLFVIDPVSQDEYYREDNTIGMPLLTWMSFMLRRESGVFAYIPQHQDPSEIRLVEKIHQIVRDSRMSAVDLTHPVMDSKGNEYRRDHNLIVAYQPVLDRAINSHFELGRKLGLNVMASILIPSRIHKGYEPIP